MANCTECGNMAYWGNKHAPWCPFYKAVEISPFDIAINELHRLKKQEFLFQRFLEDTTEDMECLPGCDSYGHEPNCPVVNPQAAFEQLREEIVSLKKTNQRLVDLCEDYFHDKNKVELKAMLKAMPGVIESDIEPEKPMIGLVWVHDKVARVWTGDSWSIIHQELTFRQFINSYAGSEEIPIDDVIDHLIERPKHPKRNEVLWECINARTIGTRWVPQGVYDDEYYNF